MWCTSHFQGSLCKQRNTVVFFLKKTQTFKFLSVAPFQGHLSRQIPDCSAGVPQASDTTRSLKRGRRSWEKPRALRVLFLSNSEISNPMSVRYGTESQQKKNHKKPKLNCLLRHLVQGEEASGVAWLFMQNSVFWAFDPCNLVPDALSRSPSLVSSRFLSGLNQRGCKMPPALLLPERSRQSTRCWGSEAGRLCHPQIILQRNAVFLSIGGAAWAWKKQLLLPWLYGPQPCASHGGVGPALGLCWHLPFQASPFKDSKKNYGRSHTQLFGAGV